MTDAPKTLSQLGGTYTIDPAHSRIGFAVRHAMVTKVRGAFNDFAGTATVNSHVDDSRVEVTIQTASIDTRNGDRDGHLKTGDFFDVEQFPTITFTSTSVKAKGDHDLEITGDLTIKGVSKQVTIPFRFDGGAQDQFGNHRIGFEGSTTISRGDFGMSFNAALETGGVLLSDKIEIDFDISAIAQA